MINDELLNAKVVFGLVNQGHIPTIEKMITDGKQWHEIAAAINWCPITARERYERYLQSLKQSTTDNSQICPLLARAVEMLRKVGNKTDTAVWDQNDIASFILKAERHLLSTTTVHPIFKDV